MALLICELANCLSCPILYSSVKEGYLKKVTEGKGGKQEKGLTRLPEDEEESLIPFLKRKKSSLFLASRSLQKDDVSVYLAYVCVPSK